MIILKRAIIAITATVCSIILAVVLSVYLIHLNASRAEYEELLDFIDTLELSEFDIEMMKINPDYVCWISIEDTTIDHPVVRAENNIKYLDTSFSGEENIFGTLFLDYRCVGYYVPNIIIYGHNPAEGDFFGNLWMFLDWHYQEEHPVITLLVNGQEFEYEIFAVRQTDVNDPAYYLDFTEPGSFEDFAERCGAPARKVAQILTLSTCVIDGDDDERLIIQGALLQSGPS